MNVSMMRQTAGPIVVCWTLGLIVAGAAFPPAIARPGGDEPAGPRATRLPVVAYIPEYRIRSLDPAAIESVTDLIFFSIETHPSGELSTARFSTDALARLHEIKSKQKTRLLVTVGGWTRSRGFAAVALDSNARERFAANLTRFCVDNRLDGADIDWEHPHGPAEVQGYAALLTEVKQSFAPRGLLLTVALAGWQDPGASAYRAVDRIHVMAYDHGGARHSTFEHARADVNVFLDRGVPSEKICLGVPFYGRKLDNPKVVATYAEVVKQYHPLPDVDLAGGFWFNGINTIRRKARYAAENGLGGIMISELGQDTTDGTSLLRAIVQELAAAR
jgi:GH18 family chitinase